MRIASQQRDEEEKFEAILQGAASILNALTWSIVGRRRRMKRRWGPAPKPTTGLALEVLAILPQEPWRADSVTLRDVFMLLRNALSDFRDAVGVTRPKALWLDEVISDAINEGPNSRLTLDRVCDIRWEILKVSAAAAPCRTVVLQLHAEA